MYDFVYDACPTCVCFLLKLCVFDYCMFCECWFCTFSVCVVVGFMCLCLACV